MKERPILFSAPMVRAILAGTKKQTRRVMNDQVEAPSIVQMCGPCLCEIVTERGVKLHGFHCPYGQPGDLLWVRETFYAWGRWETRHNAKKGRDEWHFVDMTLECGRAYEYPASGGPPQPMAGKRDSGVTPRWWKRPAIHMPRAASRMTLEITVVRVERLQDISEADAISEGIETMAEHRDGRPTGGTLGLVHWTGIPPEWGRPVDAFSTLWTSINGAESWDANPWVWCVEFTRSTGGDENG